MTRGSRLFLWITIAIHSKILNRTGSGGEACIVANDVVYTCVFDFVVVATIAPQLATAHFAC